jgi:NAD+ kinase
MMRWECKRIGIVVKRNSKEALTTAREIVSFLNQKGLEPVNATLNKIPSNELGLSSEPQDFDEEICRVIVIGGDGTFLRVIQELTSKELSPVIMTIGAGRRCFYFDIDSSEATLYIDRFLKNDFLVQQYFLGSISIENEKTYSFLNEAVLVGDRARLARLEVYIGTTKLYDVFGDGLIISTSTGSTAYSLSAGGPVIEPSFASFVITPLASIQLSNRPVVISPLLEIRVLVRKDGVMPRLIIDGIDKGYVERGKTLYFKIYKKPLHVARFKWVRFYERTFERKTLY